MSRYRVLALILLLIAAAAALSGCLPETLRLTEAQDGSIQEARVGDTIQVRLRGNATTGYEWIRTSPSSLEGQPISAPTERLYVPDKGSVVGAPGTFLFTYRAKHPGTVTLSYDHLRTWEDEPIDHASFILWIH